MALIEVTNLKKYYPLPRKLFTKPKYTKAVDGVSFSIEKRQTMGLVGESGCGKSTVGRTILRLTNKTEGTVRYDGIDLHSLSNEAMRILRPKLQIIFQDPFSSLSPRLPVGELIGEAVREHEIVSKNEYNAYIESIMNDCGLSPYHRNRYPHEFSGGQRQRICIARALALNPNFIVCDEPVSALDVSIQAQIVNLLQTLQEKYHLAYLFISHDLSVVEHICNEVAVMYLGNIVEHAPTEELYKNPLHPYTKALFSAIPIPNPHAKRDRIILSGTLPNPSDPPSGCKFHTRCPHCMEKCKSEQPILQNIGNNHAVACHLYQS